jgi:hypothetical protein
LGAPDECDLHEPDELDYRYKGDHIFVYGEEIDQSGNLFNKTTGGKIVDGGRREEAKRHSSSSERNIEGEKEERSASKGKERYTETPYNGNRANKLHHVSS